MFLTSFAYERWLDSWWLRWLDFHDVNGSFCKILLIFQFCKRLCNCKSLTFFLTLSKMNRSVLSWWQIRDGHYLQNFAKINFDFFLSVKHDEKKRSFVMTNSQWPPFAKSCKYDFLTFFYASLKTKEARYHFGEFAISIICEILEKRISNFF